MALKRPSCGFDSPDGSSCCDFRKAPFRKKDPPAPTPPAPSEEGTVQPPTTVIIEEK